MGSSIVVHKHWSGGQSMIVNVRDDNEVIVDGSCL